MIYYLLNNGQNTQESDKESDIGIVVPEHISNHIMTSDDNKNTLKHIFNTLLLYTKNLNLTVYHCKKAYLFYVEFITQIGDENHSFLQLNSKDAVIFLYKKTIFEILFWPSEIFSRIFSTILVF